MTGVKSYNFPAFDAARDMLRAEGWSVISPADMDRELGFDPDDTAFVITKEFLELAMKRDIEAIYKVDAIYMLDGWQESIGARAEHALATWRHIEVIYQMPDRNPKDIAGSKKCPMHLLPPVALEEAAWAHGLGAGKYGAFNWRQKKISASQYVGAALRHLMKWNDREDNDHESGRCHLAHVVATMNIVMDAKHHGCLIDDRPTTPLPPCSSPTNE